MVDRLNQAKLLVFHDSAYPRLYSDPALSELIPGEFTCASASELATCLLEGHDLLLSFHGAYFPAQAWGAILTFLERGGNLAVFGGMPFTHPVDPDGQPEPEQQAYTDQLYLGPFFPLDLEAEELRLAPEALCPRERELALSAQSPGNYWSFYPMLTQVLDSPEDLGSAGPVDTLLTPLISLRGTSTQGERQLATPFVLLDQQAGRFTGGRWLLSPWQPTVEADWLDNAALIRDLIELTLGGASVVEVRPGAGCFQPGESPSLIVSARSPRAVQLQVTVFQPDGEPLLESFSLEFAGSALLHEQRVPLPAQSQPGLYRVESLVSYARSSNEVALRQETGFRIWDEKLVVSLSAKGLTVGRDYFFQEGRPFLVFGTTYMDSQVQRKFLTLPNPARWERDFKRMKEAGINLVRTGIWTGWRDFMPMAGVANEAELRALDALVMTACAHDIQLVFTFFTFYPPLYGGENPWLDPRSVQTQLDFVTLLARRYAAVSLVSWDLINEPSFGDPAKIFSTRAVPHYDRFEEQVFRTWLAERYSLEELRLRWRLTPVDLAGWEQVTLPRERDYSTDTRDNAAHQMLKVADFTHFSQDMFTRWAGQMYAAMREVGCQTPIGVGQDEAGARPAPQFYAQAVDYTTTHPWWNNDELLWDMLLNKTPYKPDLIQETGVMLVLDVDGRPWCDEQEAAILLERKLFTGLIARSAGLVQWLWHINPYMVNQNENSIGLVRVDGSEKPELQVMLEFGRLMQSLQTHIREQAAPAPTWVIVPYSQWFMRPELAIEATKSAIRILGYDFGIVPQMIGEQQLRDLAEDEEPPAQIILPGVQYFSAQAWEALERLVGRGSTLLVSGVVARDQHNLVIEPALLTGQRDFDVAQEVRRYEQLELGSGERYQLDFPGDKTASVKKAHGRLDRFEYGKGRVFWSGLPLELARNQRVVRRVYQEVLGQQPADLLEDSPLLLVKQEHEGGTLILLVSESALTQQVELEDGTRLEVAPNRAGAALVGADGEISTFGGVSVFEED